MLIRSVEKTSFFLYIFIRVYFYSYYDHRIAINITYLKKNFIVTTDFKYLEWNTMYRC